MKIYKNLKSNFIYGIGKGFLYYVLGVTLTWLTYVIFGWHYMHAPGLFHIVAFLFFLGGIFWAFYYFVLLLIGNKSKVNFGVLTIHIIVILSVIIIFYVGVKKIQEVDVLEYDADKAATMMINKDTTLVLNVNGDTLYFKKGDSILIKASGEVKRWFENETDDSSLNDEKRIVK